MSKLIIFFSILMGGTAAVCAVLFYNLSLLGALAVYAFVGSAIIMTWVMALISKDNASRGPAS